MVTLKRILVGSSSVAICIFFLGQLAHAQSERQTAEAVIQAHIDHRNRFVVYKCNFTVSYCRVRSIDDAIHRRYLPQNPPRVSKQFWARDHNKFCTRIVEDEETTRILNSPKKLTPVPGRENLLMGTPTPFSTSQELADGDYRLTWNCSTMQPTLNITGGEDLYYMTKTGPLGDETGVHGAENRYEVMLSQLRAGLGEIHVTLLNGILEVDFINDNSDRLQSWFIPNEGYRLRKSILTSCIRKTPYLASIFHTEYLDPVPFSNNRWCSKRKILVLNQGTNYTMWDTQVTDLLVDETPKQEDFVIKVPIGTSVLQVRPRGKPQKHFFTEQSETIHVEDLPELWKSMSNLPEHPLDLATIPTQSKRRQQWLSIVAAVAGSLCILYVVVSTLRRRKSNQPSTNRNLRE
jgi:hypothetical protein